MSCLQSGQISSAAGLLTSAGFTGFGLMLAPGTMGNFPVWPYHLPRKRRLGRLAYVCIPPFSAGMGVTEQ
ncbi:hypothetical protein [Alcanivorax sp.]|uniref:hypothetical protein n=1 Tax=Alcanivorax sp. TaxID=1872427 RepID=UPI0025C73740|nr:hypothetical protein [Alcanivorax sp.]